MEDLQLDRLGILILTDKDEIPIVRNQDLAIMAPVLGYLFSFSRDKRIVLRSLHFDDTPLRQLALKGLNICDGLELVRTVQAKVWRTRAGIHDLGNTADSRL